MASWWRKRKAESPAGEAGHAMRNRYGTFRELLSLNDECLEILASIQEDLQYTTAREEVLADRVASIFDRTDRVVEALGTLTARDHPVLARAARAQRREVERHLAASRARPTTALSASLSDVDISAAGDVGSKAAHLGEVKNRLRLPVPDGFALTAEAYRQFCETPVWMRVRDATRRADLGDLGALQEIASRLTGMVMELPLPRELEAAITEGTRALLEAPAGLSVRSSAVGEGDERTFAGQFLSLLGVPPGEAVDAYRRVVASRFSDRALCYRLSGGLAEVDSPMAVLVLPFIRARTSGVLYTRDPGAPKGEALWVSATRGPASEIGAGASLADLFVVARGRGHRVLEQRIATKGDPRAPREGGGLVRPASPADESASPSLTVDELALLADRGTAIERHFGTPQDVEWVFDEDGRLWFLQSRPLTMVDASAARDRSRVREDALLSGGRSVFPGRTSGPAHLVADPRDLGATPDGAVVFLRRATPEIVEVFPRIAGLAAEWGNPTGHAAALLRESRIPSVFQLTGAFERLRNGDVVSLDAAQVRVYPGALWPARPAAARSAGRPRGKASDPVTDRLLALHLLDPASLGFRPASCRSAHDVLRFCHEKAIEAMFVANDSELARDEQCSKRLLTPAPVDMRVLDLGAGLAPEAKAAVEVSPSQIRSRPFQALWRGVCHPDVSWTRGMPASLTDLASVMATSLAPQNAAIRALGEKSYLLVADEYMNLNSRLAFHFTLVDACVSDTPGHNYVSFRFAGGGAGRDRRDLRARFIEACLAPHGFRVDRRGDLVNAWIRKAPARETEASLDLLGRLMACASQLDMYMSGDATMRWYVRQFLRGNYAFRLEESVTNEATGVDV
jgi:pyruvate,water dikinase